MLQLAIDLNLVFLDIPRNSSMALDPLDLTIFGRLKALMYRFCVAINRICAPGSTVELTHVRGSSSNLLKTHRKIAGTAGEDAVFRAGGFKHGHSPRQWTLCIVWMCKMFDWRDVSPPPNPTDSSRENDSTGELGQ